MGLKHTKVAVNNTNIVTATDWNATDSHNWYSGSITISDTNTEGAVTLSPAEADANYIPQLTIINYSTNCSMLGYRVKRTTIATGGFTVQLSAPPGAGESITIGYTITR